MSKATSSDKTTVQIRKKFLFADPQKNMKKPCTQKQEFGNPSLQLSLRCLKPLFIESCLQKRLIIVNSFYGLTKKVYFCDMSK